MHKVILVDDEIFFRKGLKSLINWNSCGFKVVGEAANGDDALSLICEINPDLVITDIRMPVLDGLELIKQVVHKEEIHSKFIILSGHSDFIYAQQAVRYGVHDFILKPVDQVEMEETLHSLSKSLTEQKLLKKRNEEASKKMMMDHLIFGKVDTKEANRYLMEQSLGNPKEFYYTIFEINDIPEESGESGFENIKVKLSTVIRELSDTQTGPFIQELGHECYGLLIPSSYLCRFQMDISKYIHWINGLLSKNIPQKITFYVGSAVPKLELLRNSYDTAQKARQYKYALEGKGVFLFEEIEKNYTLTYTELEDSFYHLLIEQIEENTAISLMETIDKIFLEVGSRQMAKGAVLTSINRCVHSILKVLKNMDGDVTSLKTFQNMLHLQNYNLTLTQLRNLFLEFVLESKEIILNLRKQSTKGEAFKIKQYIDLHYHENISLKTLAAKFFMNPVYLGQLFKKTYGMYFKDYLLQVRINEAKKLLRQSEKRIYEIAECVGFNNTDYFVTIFGKMEKSTPSEYRNKLIDERKVN